MIHNSQLADGYYLSGYITINPLANLYDIRLVNRHDQNLALWRKDGNDIHLVHYWEVERISGRKHHSYAWYDASQFREIMDTLLADFHLSTQDIRAVWGIPQIEPHEAENESEYTYHSLCHLFSALMLDTDLFYNETIISLALDYGADYETECIRQDREKHLHEYVGCVSVKGDITYFPIESPAAIWSVAAQYHGMEEGSLMALGSATECRLLEPDFDFDLRICGIENDVAYRIYQQLCEPMEDMDEAQLLTITTGYDDRFSLRENKISAAIKVIQAYSIHAMERQVRKVLDAFHLDPTKVNLAMSGGFSLNCPTNSYLMDTFGFRRFIAPPCINDSGQALGIGLYEFYRNGVMLNFHFGDDAFKGNEAIFDEQIRNQLLHSGYVAQITPFDPQLAAEDLIRGPMVWVDGRAEIGPRALGHRSLLASAMTLEAKDALNEIKQRQFWRPVAPIVLEEKMDEWFEAAAASPFMLRIFRIRPEKEHLVPAIAHLDSSARAQTISGTEDYLHKVLLSFYEKTGVPIICNTSLNDRGEPIIDQPIRAVEFALEKNVKIVYVNGWRILLQRHEEYRGELRSVPRIDLMVPDRELRMAEKNPFGLPREVISKLTRTIKYRNMFDIEDPEGAKQALEMYERRKHG